MVLVFAGCLKVFLVGPLLLVGLEWLWLLKGFRSVGCTVRGYE